MRVVILAGGLGTRIAEHTGQIPKPMLPVGNQPLLWHIMQWYAKFGHEDFVIALGYKEEVVRSYFQNFFLNSSDIEVDISNGTIRILRPSAVKWRVKLMSTGLTTMTGGRLKRLRDHVGGETFLLTYGDGVSNVDLDTLLDVHRRNRALVTMTAVRPPARFGELKVEGDLVKAFEEKPQIDTGWINGGFMAVEPEVLDYIEGDETMFEREPLSRVAREGRLAAHFHHGFWQCVDTKREYDRLQELFLDSPPWIDDSR